MQHYPRDHGRTTGNQEQQPLIIENVEILDRDQRQQQLQQGNVHRRSDSSSDAYFAATRQSPSDTPPYYAYSQPPPRSYSGNYGAVGVLSQSLPPTRDTHHRVQYNQHQPPRHMQSSSAHQHAPPPYPNSLSRSSKRARSVVSEPMVAPSERAPPVHHVATLSMDDIEQAFHVALHSQQQPEYYQLDAAAPPPPPPWNEVTASETYLHPLKRESPPTRQNRNYGSIPAATAFANVPVRTRQSPLQSPVSRSSSPLHHNMAPSGRQKDHRRVRSDSPARQIAGRSYTNDSFPQQQLNHVDVASSQRRRSVDAGPSSSKSSSAKQPQQPRQIFFPSLHQAPQHRRRASYQSSTGGSVRSDISLMSYRSDIRKSTYFEDFNSQTGKAELNYPNSHVHLVMDERRSLVYGHVYAVPVHPRTYEDYYATLQEQEEGSLGFDFDLGNLNYCGCDCPQCAACRGKAELPRRFYAIGVQDDLYRRVVDEMSLSRDMPCGLFFCGHHSDVRRPSILIAVALVGILLMAMLVGACLMTG